MNATHIPPHAMATLVEADHAAARVVEAAATERAEALAAERHREYRAYLCSMTDHGCLCIALGFDEWAAVSHA